MSCSCITKIDEYRDPGEHVGARWRRRLGGLVMVLTVGALIGPATAGAGLLTLDPDLGSPDGTVWYPDPVDENDTETTDTGSTTTNANWTTASSSCVWRVDGRLVVRDPTVDGLADKDPIEGVEVKVSGRSWAGLYNEWDTVTTDSNGEFSVSKTECDDRKVKVQAKFDSDDLRVTSSNSVDWYLLHETDGTIGHSNIHLNGEPFGGESTGDLSTSQARTDAQTWIVYRKALDYADTIGYPFLNNLTVHNPATLTQGVSAADPILGDIHIDPNDTADLDAWLHEAGHAWAYPREIGEGCLTWDALISGDTHDAQETPCAAVNEGFAEFFSDKIEQEMNTAGLIQSYESPSDTTTPMTRAKLAQTYDLANLDMVARSDFGWEQVFRVLTSSDITRQLFGSATGAVGSVSTYGGRACAGQPVDKDDLAEALHVFGDAQHQLDLQNSEEPSVSDLLNRAADRLPGFDSSDATAYLDAIDPTSLSEPHEFAGGSRDAIPLSLCTVEDATAWPSRRGRPIRSRRLLPKDGR
jgi:hypothetical protein